ncbi:LysR family substrate-binding domain-containing protein [Streptomyces sp. NBC_01231]|nr:LysR family substrate-binding domain-containing protein [Streptomyces sp. NBC_01231]
MTGSAASPSFRLAYVPGVTPGKWARIWNDRLPGTPLELVAVPDAEAPSVLRDGGADAAFVRLPVDRTVFSAIPLYTETTVVVVPKDHVMTAVDEVSCADLAEETVLHPLDDVLDWERPPGEPAFERPATTADAVELVAAGIGVLVVPQSVARLHHRRDLTYRPVVDAPQSEVALSWPEDATTDQVEDLIGIVRGRTPNSTRGRAKPASESGAERKRAEKGTASSRKSAGQSSRGGTGRTGGGRSGSAGAPKGTRRGKPRRRS